MRFFGGEPSARFMTWTRRILIALWILLLIVEVPSLVSRAHQIRSGTVPGSQRNAAMRELVSEAAGVLIVGPLLVFALVGYGIGVRPALTVWSSGGPWFIAWWRPGRQPKSQKREARK